MSHVRISGVDYPTWLVVDGTVDNPDLSDLDSKLDKPAAPAHPSSLVLNPNGTVSTGILLQYDPSTGQLFFEIEV